MGLRSWQPRDWVLRLALLMQVAGNLLQYVAPRSVSSNLRTIGVVLFFSSIAVCVVALTMRAIERRRRRRMDSQSHGSGGSLPVHEG